MIFKDRQWPEGFVFPACEACNQASRAAEKQLGLLVHGTADGDDRAPYKKLVASVRGDHPGVVEHMLPGRTSEVRSLLRGKGLSKPRGMTLRELPIIKLDVAHWQPLFDVFVAKMMMALHYQCFGVSLSRNGRLWYALHTNVDLAAGLFPDDVFEGAVMALTPQRNKRLLIGQFDLIWQSDASSRTGLWSFAFHNKIAFTGFTTELCGELSDNSEKTFTPFPWPAQNTRNPPSPA